MEMMKSLSECRHVADNRIRRFCFQLLKFYTEDSAGKRRRKLLESEQATRLEKNIFHVEADGNLYRQATEGSQETGGQVTESGDKRKRVISDEHESENQGNSEVAIAPYQRDLSTSCLFPQDSPSSPDHSAVLEEPLTNDQDDPFHDDDLAAQRSAAMASLNQKVEWKVGNHDFLSKFLDFKAQASSRYSLALDGVADLSPGSEFTLTLPLEERPLACAVSTSEPDINEKWPTLLPILSRVCAPTHSYDDVVNALKNEDANDPIVEYLRWITYNYSHHLKFSNEVCQSLNEREGFGDFTWPFIRGALTMVGIRSRQFEILVGTKKRISVATSALLYFSQFFQFVSAQGGLSVTLPQDEPL
ncbi:hypothetical protein EMPS_06617 [Entomortierella parvispora]|uniref:Uncharacterized protein n=1 Tax=Entomortierella parvispora TaxID=205924 RepID=A0A9P3LXL2_9FUNG|nr:hypothetical protein EMPS_06617 [Entomortierella parvispora]